MCGLGQRGPNFKLEFCRHLARSLWSHGRLLRQYDKLWRLRHGLGSYHHAGQVSWGTLRRIEPTRRAMRNEGRVAASHHSGITEPRRRAADVIRLSERLQRSIGISPTFI